MVIKKKKETKGIVIDLTGPDGNAFNLLAQAGALARKLDLDDESIQKEMESGDYENLVAVFDKHFGHIVTLLR